MSAKGSPRENAQAEIFFRTLKLEEVYLQDYRTFSGRGGLHRLLSGGPLQSEAVAFRPGLPASL